MTVIPIVIGALWFVPRCFEQSLAEFRIRKRIETIPTADKLDQWIYNNNNNNNNKFSGKVQLFIYRNYYYYYYYY